MTAPAHLGGREVRALLFDYGHTLITYERPEAALIVAYREIAARLAAAGYRDVPAAERLLTEVHDRIEAAVAAHERSDLLEEMDLVAEERAAYRATGLDLPPELLDEVTRLVQEAWWQGIHLPAGVIAVLTELRRRGLRLGLCSNAPYRVASMHGQLAHLGLDRVFDSVTFSSAVAWRKPSPRLFAAALEALGAEAATTVMVGDRGREDIEGARAVGMGTVRSREHRDDPPPGEDADAVIAHLGDLVALLFGEG